MKKRTRSFRQQRVPLKPCPSCIGAGTKRGVFFEMPCPDCHASGLVDKDTGEALALEDLVLQLMLRWRESRNRERELAAQLREARREADRGHGPMGMRYHGD